MNQQAYPTEYRNVDFQFPPDATELHPFPVNHSLSDEVPQVGFTLDPTAIQEQYNTSSSFGDYTSGLPVYVTQEWTFPQQGYINSSAQSTTQQIVSQFNLTRRSISDEGDDTSEPTSPRDEASEKRREVSQCIFQP